MATSKQINDYVKAHSAKKANEEKIKEKCPELFAQSKVLENQLKAMKKTILKDKAFKNAGFLESFESTTNKLVIKTIAIDPSLRTTIAVNPKN